jgi:hypothetical protein
VGRPRSVAGLACQSGTEKTTARAAASFLRRVTR